MKKRKPFRFLGMITALAMCCSFSTELFYAFGGMTAAAEDEEIIVIEPQENINRDEELEVFVEPEYSPMFSFPSELRGVYITPGVEYALQDEEGDLTSEEIAAGVEEMLDKVEANRLNALIINTDSDGEYFYSTNVNDTIERAAVEYAIDGARERGMYVYLTFSIKGILSDLEQMSLQERIDLLALKVHNFTVKYPVDGIVLDGYYSSRSNTSLNDYMENGSGIGFDNWLMDNGAYVFSLAADAVRKTNNTVPVGISINDVWANYSTDENGSETSVNFEALTDGYADTLGYIKKGYADFIMLRAEGSRSDSYEPFDEISDWWNNVAAEAEIPFFVRHINEQICTDAAGWGSPDELVKQVINSSELSSCGGNVFNSLAALEKNSMESTTVLMKHYDDTIDLEGLNSELEMTLPTKTTFKTEEPEVIFAGSFDPNFPVYYQGKEIKLNEAGRFYFTEELDVGVNTFKFQNKAKVITYKITRTINVLKDVAPSEGTMRVEEQSTISLSAIAYKGSVVTAKINGKSVELKEVDGQTDEIDPNSSYTKYVGKYTAPEGIKGEDIDLGNVVFYGTYQTKTGDFNESRTGAHIIVNALAEILNDYSGQLLVVNNDNTMVYSSKNTDTAPTPDMARLPAGTLDYIVNSVTYDGTNYYLTNTGKRLKKSAVSVQENRPLGSNPISVSSVYKDGTDTVIKFKTASKIPFEIKYDGLNYDNGDNGDFYVSGFNASGLTITFDYITSISAGEITFPDTAVFTSGTWSTTKAGEMTRTMLSLSFRQTGIFSGVTTTYDSEGNLTFRFNGCRSSVSGATIVIDPGHGYTGKSAFDPGAVGHIKEQTANLAIAKYLTEILEAEGANVIRFKTESETYRTEERSATARQYSPDMFISVHCNAAGKTATGAEAYYFTPFSQPLADYVSAELGSYLKSNVHSDGNGDRGEKYNYFWVTLQQDFPSILVETAYVTNYEEAMALADSGHQRNFAQAIADGVKKYFARCNYSSYGDGYGTVAGGSTVWEEPTADMGGEPSGGEFTVIPDEDIQTEPPAETLPPLPDETITTEATLPSGYDPRDPYYQYFFGNKTQ
ncbi:MAG: N-acetylmuramoyl-L-alanine amidase [Oscillospiraceae bacterium]|nr:N-acetylmuramoyl-L-alanine amidase [Oscillospiraceae bacterium]